LFFLRLCAILFSDEAPIPSGFLGEQAKKMDSQMSDDLPLRAEDINLKRLAYSPRENPFAKGSEIRTRHKTVRTRASGGRDLVDSETGEIVAQSAIHIIEEKDEQEFIKVFSEGVKAAFDLSRTGARVFQAVLNEYERAPMHRGYADSLMLFWFGPGLNEKDIGMSDRTFHNGLKELLAKGFLAPKSPNHFWVNPALFFKGDRVAFLREYRRPARSGREMLTIEAHAVERIEEEE
jgi:hypothetical protein